MIGRERERERISFHADCTCEESQRMNWLKYFGNNKNKNE